MEFLRALYLQPHLSGPNDFHLRKQVSERTSHTRLYHWQQRIWWYVFAHIFLLNGDHNVHFIFALLCSRLFVVGLEYSCSLYNNNNNKTCFVVVGFVLFCLLLLLLFFICRSEKHIIPRYLFQVLTASVWMGHRNVEERTTVTSCTRTKMYVETETNTKNTPHVIGSISCATILHHYLLMWTHRSRFSIIFSMISLRHSHFMIVWRTDFFSLYFVLYNMIT